MCMCMFFQCVHVTANAFTMAYTLSAVAHKVHCVDGDKVGVGVLCNHIFHPNVRVATVVNEHIAIGNGHNVFDGGLIAVQVNTVVNQENQFHFVNLFPE